MALLRRVFPPTTGSSAWHGYLCESSCLDKHSCGEDKTTPHWQHWCVECGFRWAG